MSVYWVELSSHRETKPLVDVTNNITTTWNDETS